MFFLVSRVYWKQPLCLGLAIMTVTKSMKGTPYWMAPEAILQTGHSLSIESSVNALASSGFLFGDGGKKATTSLEKLTKEANKAEQTTKALDFVPSEIVVPLSNEQLVGEKETHESSGEQSGKEEKKWTVFRTSQAFTFPLINPDTRAAEAGLKDVCKFSSESQASKKPGYSSTCQTKRIDALTVSCDLSAAEDDDLTESKVYLFDQRLNRSSEEQLGQKLGYILGKSNFHRREANDRLS
ncbi:hypothetical protein KY284_027140 [Solanum tuberosum]|nr:hypothetical protein KY284_027140 [Solanum tuberosum]